MFRSISRLHCSLRSLPQSQRSITSPGTASVGSLEFLSRTIWGNTVEPSPQFSVPCCRFSSSRRKKSDEDHGDDLFLVSNRDPDSPPRLFVVQPRLRPDAMLRSKLSEALNLANSLEEQRDGLYAEEFGDKEVPPHIVVQNPLARHLRAHADRYFGPGTVETVKAHIKGSESKDKLDAVFVNTILSGVQQRNLECAWEKPVLDRVGIIIEIFNAHAQTKEAKLQSELAALMYKKTRLVRFRGPGGRLSFGASGEAEVEGKWGRGFISGAGESELHLQRRRIQERRIHLLAQIGEVRRTRALQRSSRRRHGGSDGQGLATVAVVGYTNAGKSTLVSALSQSDVYSDDRKKALLSDTVGFISDLPVQLVEAFHATLEEVVEADLLVHVLDSSAVNLDEQRSTVLQVLHQIGVSPEKIQDMIEVWNKIDLLEGEGGDHETADWSTTSELSEDDLASEDDGINGDEDLDAETSGSSQEHDDGPSEDHSTEEEAACWASPGGPIGEDERQKNQFQECILSKQASHHVKTSAVLGVGLQELLHLIDEKLDSQKSFRERGSSSGPFDRKWRPPQVTVGADG